MQGTPSSHQQENLSRMTAILAGNWKGDILARSLWDFFSFKLYCAIRDDDGSPNKHRIEGIDSPTMIGDVRILLSIRRNDRQEEGLIHELLHANLIPLGYPKFWIEEQEPAKLRLAEGITNNAEHVPMLPVYLSLGYARNRFLGSIRRVLTQRERRVISDIENMATDLVSPARYVNAVSRYLRDHKINATPIYVGDEIAKRKFFGS